LSPIKYNQKIFVKKFIAIVLGSILDFCGRGGLSLQKSLAGLISVKNPIIGGPREEERDQENLHRHDDR
jgi:hypothetical protein